MKLEWNVGGECSWEHWEGIFPFIKKFEIEVLKKKKKKKTVKCE